MTGTSDSFKQFEGIDEPRNVQARQKTSLERIAELADAFLDEPREEIMEYIDVNYSYGLLFKYISKKYKQFSEQLAGVPIDETTLESFVFSKANSEHSEEKSIALGIFTGALAYILTERNKAQGKRTRIYINGHGNKFDYLFYGAHNLDEIFLQNLRGNRICSHIQTISRLVGVSLYGNSILNECGGVKKKERVKEIVMIGINGDNNLSFLDNINYLTAVGMNGKNNIAVRPHSGYAKRIIGFNISETHLLKHGSCDEIIFIGTELGDTNTGFPMPSSSPINKKKLVHYEDVPFTIGAQLYKILYNGSVEEYTIKRNEEERGKQQNGEEHKCEQNNTCLDADKLAEHLKDKPKYEIVRIVDDMIRYSNELSERLLVR